MKLTSLPTTLFTAFVLAFAVSASAQDFSQEEQQPIATAEEMAVIETETMSVELDLAPEQTEKLSKINNDFFKKKKELKDRKASDREFSGIYETRDNSVKNVLTQEQFKNWKNPPRGKGNNNSNNGNSSENNSGNNGNGNNSNSGNSDNNKGDNNIIIRL
jgi:hypothetical protein